MSASTSTPMALEVSPSETSLPVSIITYQPQYQQAFRDLNMEWIERLFQVEAPDLKVLNDPQGQIIDRGGQIFFALDTASQDILGTVALVPHEDNVFEMAKMAVTPKAQNRKIGYQLGQALIAYAKTHGIHTLMLETNSSLKNSIHLYEKLGFTHVPLTNATPYIRADVRMVLTL